MKNNVLVFDLDDTLIDTKIRHYKVLYEYLKNHEIATLSFAEYLSIRKKEEWSNTQIIKQYYPDVESQFSQFWKKNIESEHYLNYDVEIVSAKLLSEAKSESKYSFILLSLRTDGQSAQAQLSQFSFANLFEEIFFVAHSDINPKINILSNLKDQYDNIIFFGDTTNDFIAATEAKVQFRGVATGLYNLSNPNVFLNINDALIDFLK